MCLLLCFQVGHFLREDNGTPLQHSCLENPMDRGAWWATVHGVAKSQTRLSDVTFTFHFHALEKEMATHSSVLAWRIPGTGEPGGLPSMGSHSQTRLRRLSSSSSSRTFSTYLVSIQAFVETPCFGGTKVIPGFVFFFYLDTLCYSFQLAAQYRGETYKIPWRMREGIKKIYKEMKPWCLITTIYTKQSRRC